MQELEKILEEIDGMIERYKENPRLEVVDICYGLNQAKRIIRKHMNDGWISVEERLPEEPKENPEFEGKKIELYLVTVKGTKYPFRAMWNGKFFTDGWSKCNVMAWHPLPEPYKPPVESKEEKSMREREEFFSGNDFLTKRFMEVL